MNAITNSASRHIAVAVLMIVPAVANSAVAQQCAPGPRCQTASAKVQSYMENAQSKLRGEFIAAGAAATNYCIMRAVGELNRLCGAELQAKGENQCASLAFAQAEEFKQKAEQSKAASQAMSSTSSSWQADCGY